jgi:hypothetical protein
MAKVRVVVVDRAADDAFRLAQHQLFARRPLAHSFLEDDEHLFAVRDAIGRGGERGSSPISGTPITWYSASQRAGWYAATMIQPSARRSASFGAAQGAALASRSGTIGSVM